MSRIVGSDRNYSRLTSRSDLIRVREGLPTIYPNRGIGFRRLGPAYTCAPITLTSGTKLGPYEIQSPLGAGGMGEVYRVLDTRLDRIVAIKILPAHLSDF
jgi:serine/threonine protein kinase